MEDCHSSYITKKKPKKQKTLITTLLDVNKFIALYLILSGYKICMTSVVSMKSCEKFLPIYHTILIVILEC